MATLNRKKKFAEVYGKSRAKYYQDGKYFDAKGDEISAAEAAKPHGVSAKESKELAKEEADADETLSNDNDAQAAEEAEAKAAWQARYDHALSEHPATLKAMAMERYEAMAEQGNPLEAPKPDFSGEGAKDKLARWLATYAVGEGNDAKED